MKIFQKLSNPFVVFVERYYPDAFVFVILLTLITFGLAVSFTDSTPIDAVQAWGNGLTALLSFMTQICIILFTAHALAHTDLMQNLLSKVAKIPKTPTQAYVLVALVAALSNLIAWSLGLIVGAIIARQVAIEADRKGLKIHYPLLVATAYAGFVVWHMGYSSSSALFVATDGHILEDKIGVIPVTATIFTNWNMLIAAVTIIGIAIICPLMQPNEKDIIQVKAKDLLKSLSKEEEVSISKKTIGDKLNHSRLLTIIFGLILLVYLIKWFGEKGFNLDLNIVNWTFLALGLLLARSPLHYVQLVKNAGSTLGPILLQFPFYAGIMGLMKDTGLVVLMSDYFTEVATASTLSFWAFISSGIVNMFVPSGGGQWVIQGPIFIAAAENLNVNPNVIVMGVAYGDQWTNMIQPFWTI
ncbi:MAG: short-chain fatty acid transporter, partial [Saprospiraceae bacterium]